MLNFPPPWWNSDAADSEKPNLFNFCTLSFSWRGTWHTVQLGQTKLSDANNSEFLLCDVGENYTTFMFFIPQSTKMGKIKQ